MRELTQIKRTRNQRKGTVHVIKLKGLEKMPIMMAPSKTIDPASAAFDVSKHTRFMSAFLEKEVAEKVTINLEWPKDKWMLLLQSMLGGKAREVSLFYHEREQISQSCKESCCEGL